MMKKSAEEVSKLSFQTFCQSHEPNSFKYCCRFGYDFGCLALAFAVSNLSLKTYLAEEFFPKLRIRMHFIHIRIKHFKTIFWI
jgi:hypothetical protein